jgi:hypothetical protein
MSTETVEHLIDSWSDSLSERIIEIRFVDKSEMKAAMSIHLKSALYDCLKIQLPQIEKDLIEAKREYAEYISLKGFNKSNLQEKIISLKAKLKEQNKLFASLDVSNMNKEMVLWFRKNSEEKLLEFYDYYNSNFRTPHSLLTNNNTNGKSS